MEPKAGFAGALRDFLPGKQQAWRDSMPGEQQCNPARLPQRGRHTAPQARAGAPAKLCRHSLGRRSLSQSEAALCSAVPLPGGPGALPVCFLDAARELESKLAQHTFPQSSTAKHDDHGLRRQLSIGPILNRGLFLSLHCPRVRRVGPSCPFSVRCGSRSQLEFCAAVRPLSVKTRVVAWYVAVYYDYFTFFCSICSCVRGERWFIVDPG